MGVFLFGYARWLAERKLASQLATNLTSVREAWIQLESEGFVVKKPNSTTRLIRTVTFTRGGREYAAIVLGYDA